MALAPAVEKQIDAVLAECIAGHELPGAVVLVVRRGKLAFRKAYGDRSVAPERVAMTDDTVFDLASLTKPVVTATLVHLLAERGKLRLGDTVARHVPEFAQLGKEAVTLEQLLLHTSGLPADNDLRDYPAGDRAAALERIHRLKLEARPGERFTYSDVGYIVLGEVVERVAGSPLDRFAHDEVFGPLGMTATTFRPSGAQASRVAPTEQRDGAWLAGRVHDPRAERMGGVAGHAGLFATADDLSVFVRTLLGGGSFGGRRILAGETVAELLRPRAGPGGRRTLGWDVQAGGVSHTGFTGTSIWMDPARALGVVLLSNRLHPDGKGNATRLRREVVRIVSTAEGRGGARTAVELGIDVLERERFAQLTGARVGLVTNEAARDSTGAKTVDVLHRALGPRLVALFTPEHGLAVDGDDRVADARRAGTGLPVFSLYGPRRKPGERELAGVDTLVVDLPDVGARFYTYETTLGDVLEAAAATKRRVVVLDRPNPGGGVVVEGPVLDAGRESFVAYHRVPVRHGMTLGELAALFDGERRIGARPSVVPLTGWKRDQLWDDTGLAWVAPSPALQSPTAALLYPGIALIETTNVSVGRGTDAAFEQIGAPWIDGDKLASALGAAGLPGVRVRATSFVPASGPHAGTRCRGVRFVVDDRHAVRSVRLGIELARQLRRLHPDTWQAKGVATLLGHRRAFEALVADADTAAIEATWRSELADFVELRRRYLIY